MKTATEVFITLTYGDEALSLAAARATLGVLQEHDVTGHIWSVGGALMRGVKQVLSETGVPFACTGIEAIPAFVATYEFQGISLAEDEQQRAWIYLLGQLARRGIIWRKHSLIAPCYSHTTEDVDYTAAAFHEVCTDLARLLASGTLEEEIQLTELPVGFRRL